MPGKARRAYTRIETPYHREAVPVSAQRLAHRRTDGLLTQWTLGSIPLANIVASAYLQGVEDATEAMYRAGVQIPGEAVS